MWEPAWTEPQGRPGCQLTGGHLHLSEVQRYLGLGGRTGDAWDAGGIDVARFVLVEEE